MRRNPRIAELTGACCVAALVLAWSQISKAQPLPLNPDNAPVVPLGNILGNGDFETLNDALQPSGWQLPAAQGAPDGATPNGPAFELVKADNGNHYALLRPVGLPATRRIAHKMVVSRAWKTLKITARVMGKNLEGGPKQYEDAHIGLVSKIQANIVRRNGGEGLIGANGFSSNATGFSNSSTQLRANFQVAF